MKITLADPFAARFAGEPDLEAASIFDALRQLDALSPGFASEAEARAAIAVNGVLINDWIAPLPPGCAILIVPRIAGG